MLNLPAAATCSRGRPGECSICLPAWIGNALALQTGRLVPTLGANAATGDIIDCRRLRSGLVKQPEALKPTHSTEMLLQGQLPVEVQRSDAESKADDDQG